MTGEEFITGDRTHPHAVSSSSSLDSLFAEMKKPEASGSIALSDEQMAPSPKSSAPPPSQIAHNNSGVISPAGAQSQQVAFPSSMPHLMLPPNQVPVFPPGATVGGANAVPEFLYQLTKMLTDDNRDIIEWLNGKIEVHSPHKLETHVLHKYFRHSKFASFQRQLNYFGFRKLAGKGKMAPCSYVNEMAGDTIASLLLIKRKTSTTPRDKKDGSKKREAAPAKSKRKTSTQQRAGISARKPPSPHLALARTAVGRGIRHNFASNSSSDGLVYAAAQQQPEQSTASSATAALNNASFNFPERQLQDSLSQLTSNYQNSLNDLASQDVEANPTPLDEMGDRAPYDSGQFLGFLSRDSSLVDLAMIPDPSDTQYGEFQFPPNSSSMRFDDFPNPEVNPSSTEGSG